MEPFGSERGCTRRCSAHFKQFLAGLVYQNAPKVSQICPQAGAEVLAK
eukprot:gene19501-biopygen2507